MLTQKKRKLESFPTSRMALRTSENWFLCKGNEKSGEKNSQNQFFQTLEIKQRFSII